MVVNLLHKKGVIILELSGKIFGPTAPEFKKVFDEQLANVSGIPKFLVDFANVTIMGSSGLGALTGAYMFIEQKGGFLAVANVGTNIENLMIHSKLIETFKPFGSEDKTVESLNAN